jgi:hypothetical protein
MTASARILHGLVMSFHFLLSATSCITAGIHRFSYPLHCSTARRKWSPNSNSWTDWDHDLRKGKTE